MVEVALPSIELGGEEALHEVRMAYGSVPRPAAAIHELRQRANRRVRAHLMEQCHCDSLFVRVHHGPVLNASEPPIA
jgi:hypothetical protein